MGGSVVDRLPPARGDNTPPSHETPRDQQRQRGEPQQQPKDACCESTKRAGMQGKHRTKHSLGGAPLGVSVHPEQGAGGWVHMDMVHSL